MNLIAELRRRNVIRMAGLYLVGAWLITQVAATLLPVFEAPGWVMKALVALLAMGFLAALVFAWVFELTPDGLKRDADVAPEQSIAPQTGKRMDRMIVAGLVAVIALMAIERLWFAQPDVPTEVAVATTAAAVTVPAQVEAAVNPKSIAVLAFENMSADRENEYFSDGIAEEILNSLSKIKTLKVAGRTSSFSFKGKHEDLRAIGKTLGVAHILEGSVRKQGDKVRVTAQLIRSDDGTHLWSETYDGDLQDVFALQENIARAITTQLDIVLNGEQATRLVNTGTTNPEAYALYLQATSIFNRRDGDRFPEAITALQEAIRLDPNYARAYSRMAALYAVLPSYTEVNVGEAHTKVVASAKAASALGPTLAEPYAALGFSYGKFPGKLLEQFQAMEHALQLEPDDVTSNFWYGLALIKSGYTNTGIARLDRALTLDPMMPNLLRWRGIMFIHAGDLAQAEPVVRRARDLGLLNSDIQLSQIVAAKGDVNAAVGLWTAGTKAAMRGFSDEDRALIAAGVYGAAPAQQRAVTLIDAFLAQPREHVPDMVSIALLHLQRPERALDVIRTQQITDTSIGFTLLWSPQGKPMRALAEFGVFIRDFGFTAVWDKYGPPDMCRKIGPGNYSCD